MFVPAKMLVIWASIRQMLVSIANREDPDQTTSEEAVWSGSVLFVYAIMAGNQWFLEHLP